MLKLLNEDLLYERLSGQIFVTILMELLSKDDKIETARGRIIDRDGKFEKAKEDEYVKEFPIADIKQDIQDFADEWADSIRSKPEVSSVKADPSPYLGFSEYIDIKFNAPKNTKLIPYYREHKGKYKNCSFKFTDHTFQSAPYRDKIGKMIRDQVDYSDKSFSEAAAEMKDKIESYIARLHRQEKDYLESLITDVSDVESDIYGSNDEKLISKFNKTIENMNKFGEWWNNDKRLSSAVSDLLNKDIRIDKDCLKDFMLLNTDKRDDLDDGDDMVSETQ